MTTGVEQQRAVFFPVPTPSLAPRLVSEGGSIRLVCQRLDRNRPADVQAQPPVARAVAGGEIGQGAWSESPRADEKGAPRKQGPVPANGKAAPRSPVPVRGLEFVGRCDPAAVAKLRLLCPVAGRPLARLDLLPNRPRPQAWKEVELVLDFPGAAKVAVPPEAAQRAHKPRAGDGSGIEPPVRDDLEGLWAVARMDALFGQASEATDFGFYGFAGFSTARRYGVQGLGGIAEINPLRPGRAPVAGDEFLDRELYETTTGAAARAERLSRNGQQLVVAEFAGKAAAQRPGFAVLDVMNHGRGDLK
jgi:hypothetical protein